MELNPTQASPAAGMEAIVRASLWPDALRELEIVSHPMPFSTRYEGMDREGHNVLDSEQTARMLAVVDRVTQDPEFCRRLNRDPLGALDEAGVRLPPEARAPLAERAVDEPDRLIRVVIGEGYTGPTVQLATVAAAAVTTAATVGLVAIFVAVRRRKKKAP